MTFSRVMAVLAAVSSTLVGSVGADSCQYHGKIDAGVAGFEINIREFGRTVKTMDLVGFSANAHVEVVWPGTGLVFKPRVLVGDGHDGDYAAVAGAIGYHIPFWNCLYVVPNVGLGWEQIHSRLDLPIPTPAGIVVIENGLRYRLHSWTPYIGCDLGWTICAEWSVCLMLQYGFANSFSKIEMLPDSHLRTNGVNVALQVDYYFTPNWSINAAGAYNTSENSERHGARGGGGRLGLGYTY